MSSATTHTPARGRHAPAAELITAADLPDPVAQRIAAIVRATRLWKSEQSDIARELIAHAHDALAAGRTPEQTADSLGDPTTIAPLLRRSARRKRPWHWHARRRTLQAIGISLLALIGVYAVLFVRFNTGSPSITHNYLAELNERNIASSTDQHALPAYEALRAAWIPETWNENSGFQPSRTGWHSEFPEPSDPSYAAFVEAHNRVRPQIDAARAASSRPTLGVLYTDRFKEHEAQGPGFTYTELEPLAPSEDPRKTEPLYTILLGWLSEAQTASRIFAFDALLAARENDATRTRDSIIAIFDTARLVGQEPFVVTAVNAMAIQTTGETILLRIIHDHPTLLTESHLTAIAHTAATSGRIARDLDFQTERRTFGDFLQRAYTDDGHGDGRLTAEGIRLALFMNGVMPGEPDDIARTDILPMRFTGPVAMLTFGSRRDQQEMHERLMGLAESLLAAAPGSDAHRRLHREVDELIETLRSDPRFRMAEMLTPAFTRAVETAHKSHAHTNATLTTIALHIHHQRTGRWPDTLAELTPHLLPTIPEDPFDPGQPIKYRLIDNTPHVYFAGADGVDNNAARSTDDAQRDVSSLDLRYDGDAAATPNVTGADWIIYPHQDN